MTFIRPDLLTLEPSAGFTAGVIDVSWSDEPSFCSYPSTSSCPPFPFLTPV